MRESVEQLAVVLSTYGFPRMAARVLLALMTAEGDDGLTAAELAEALEVSPASISGAVSTLSHLDLLRRRAVPGSRRDRYVLPDDTWYAASVAKGDLLVHLADLADDGVRAVGGRRTPAGRRLAEMADFYRFVAGEMDGLLERWEATRGAASTR